MHTVCQLALSVQWQSPNTTVSNNANTQHSFNLVNQFNTFTMNLPELSFCYFLIKDNCNDNDYVKFLATCHDIYPSWNAVAWFFSVQRISLLSLR